MKNCHGMCRGPARERSMQAGINGRSLLIQGSAADLIKVAMVKVDRALKAENLRTKMVLQIHDELVFDVPREEAERVKEIVRREMTTALDFGVPLDVGIGVGDNWLEAH